jgi:glycosyltransferase involved in cell wall biosynthesis
MIPVSVIVNTKNSDRVLDECLTALKDFGEVVVLDSASTDKTRDLAKKYGARLEDFAWNGQYPKKRQWALDNLNLKHDYVFFVDADEIVTPELIKEIAALDFSCAGYYVRGRYKFEDKVLRFGLANNKLSLFHRAKFEHPVINDLDIPGMGEIEGHYQPVLKNKSEKIGQLKNALIHDAYDDGWMAKHERYAEWEAMMNKRRAWPQENSGQRAALKRIFRATPLRSLVAFIHCYYFKLGLLDGGRGYRFAQSRAFYYLAIARAQAKLSPTFS